jgi:hypothetical protein
LCDLVEDILTNDDDYALSEDVTSTLCWNKRKIKRYFQQVNVRFDSVRFKEHFCQIDEMVGQVGNWGQCGKFMLADSFSITLIHDSFVFLHQFGGFI